MPPIQFRSYEHDLVAEKVDKNSTQEVAPSTEELDFNEDKKKLRDQQFAATKEFT